MNRFDNKRRGGVDVRRQTGGEGCCWGRREEARMDCSRQVVHSGHERCIREEEAVLSGPGMQAHFAEPANGISERYVT